MVRNCANIIQINSSLVIIPEIIMVSTFLKATIDLLDNNSAEA
jgi:hypothetical protein